MQNHLEIISTKSVLDLRSAKQLVNNNPSVTWVRDWSTILKDQFFLQETTNPKQEILQEIWKKQHFPARTHKMSCKKIQKNKQFLQKILAGFLQDSCGFLQGSCRNSCSTTLSELFPEHRSCWTPCSTKKCLKTQWKTTLSQLFPATQLFPTLSRGYHRNPRKSATISLQENSKKQKKSARNSWFLQDSCGFLQNISVFLRSILVFLQDFLRAFCGENSSIKSNLN